MTISANASNAPRTAPIAAWTRLLFVHNHCRNKVTLWITFRHVDGLSGLSYNPIYVLNSALSVRELLKTHRNPVACHKSWPLTALGQSQNSECASGGARGGGGLGKINAWVVVQFHV